MLNTALIGAQWGDEGKGKIIDFLARDADIIIRYQGGNNAGHTVKVGSDLHILHLIPSGILHTGKICVIGNGVVVDPVALMDEISALEQKGIEIGGRLLVSDRSHLVLPCHSRLDEIREARRSGRGRIGTTKRGIGPAYSDKSARVGLRACDALDAGFPELLDRRMSELNELIEHLGGETAREQREAVKRYTDACMRMAPRVSDTVTFLNAAADRGKSLLFEGAQGTMLDIDFGTYPFVTSSNATIGGISTGSGIAPRHIKRVIGVIKAYTTRVGEGPFPTELFDETGKLLGREGREFGATTGRPRRCGWFDAVVARYAAMINGVDFWAITKLDVLDTLEKLRICAAYECDGKTCDTIPANVGAFERCKPVYEEMEGWRVSTKDATSLADLPSQARAYVNRICELTRVPLGILSVGAKRENTLLIGI